MLANDLSPGGAGASKSLSRYPNGAEEDGAFLVVVYCVGVKKRDARSR